MKKLARALASMLLISVAAASIAAQKQPASAVKQIDVLARSIEREKDRRKEPDVVIADTSDFDKADPKWTRFRSVKALDDARKETEAYTIAYNWRSKRKLAAATFTYFSP